MALNGSGPISLIGATAGQSIQQELGLSGQISLLDTDVRTLAGVPTGSVTMPTNFYGKSSAFVFNQTITSNTNDYNLRNAAIAGGWNQVSVLQATITINAGVFVGSSSTGSAAFQTGSSFPAGSTLTVINNGSIVGRGGNGGSGGGSGGGGGAGVVNSSGGARGTNTLPANAGSPGTNTAGGAGGAQGSGVGGQGSTPIGIAPTGGSSGGLALQVLASLTLTNNGTIGGGGGGGGGGGVQLQPFPPDPQLVILINYVGGTGGGLGTTGSAGQSGNAYSGGAGGSAGAAISGNSNITYLATGTRLGAIS